MSNEDFKLNLIRSLENNELFIQIYFQDEYFAKISKEFEKINIEIYASEKNKKRYFSLNNFINILEIAKHHFSMK